MVFETDLPSGGHVDTGWCAVASVPDIDREIALVIEYAARLATIRNLRTPLLRLAPELLDIVLDEVNALTGPEGMHVCSLVCSQLAPYAQARMFAELPLVTAADAVRALQLARTKPDIYRRTKHLRLASALQDYDEHFREALADPDRQTVGSSPLIAWDALREGLMDELFGPLICVRDLRLVQLSAEHPLFAADWTARGIVVCTAVERLTLRLCDEFTMYQIRDMMSAFPRLQTIEMQDCQAPTTATMDVEPHCPLQVQTFVVDSPSLDMLYHPSFTKLAAFVSLRCSFPTNMTPATFLETVEETRLRFEKMLAQAGPSLSSISLAEGTVEESKWAADAISHYCPSVRDISMSVYWPIFEQVVPTINALDTPFARTIVLESLHEAGATVSMRQVEVVCKLLQSPNKFSNLQALHLIFCGQQPHGQVIGDMQSYPLLRRTVSYEERANATHELERTFYDISDLGFGNIGGLRRSVVLFICRRKNIRFKDRVNNLQRLSLLFDLEIDEAAAVTRASEPHTDPPRRRTVHKPFQEFEPEEEDTRGDNAPVTYAF